MADPPGVGERADAYLRTRRAVRRPQSHRGHKGNNRGQLVATVHISEGPPEADDRAVPGN